jgi:hypothetical protein
MALLFCLAAPPLFAATVHLHLFDNPSGDTALTAKALELQEILAREIRDRGILVTPFPGSVPEAHSTDEISVISGRFVKGDTALRVEAALELGVNHTVYEKSVEFNPGETLAQNAEPLVRKICLTLEEKYSAMLQVVSTPSACSLYLNNRLRGVTPFESFCPVGRNDLVLRAEGYETLRDFIRIAPGNNRYSFILKKEESSRELWKRWYVYTFIGGWAALAAGFYFHSAYKSAHNSYLAVRSVSQKDYDRYYDIAERSLVLRNLSFAFSAGLITVSVLKLKAHVIL